ncbi:hypothetical protein AB0900_30840 [Streptomyces cellulosae]
MMPTWPDDRLDAIRAWLKANNINPSDVPIRGDLYLEPDPDGGQRIAYEAFHLDSQGRKHVDERGTGAAIERRTTPLLVDPPDWWEPYRKPTREQLLEAVTRVRALHQQEGDYCAICTTDYGRLCAPWPCPTIKALEIP